MQSLRALQFVSRRTFSSSGPALANRAIVYSQNGEPTSVLRVVTYPSLPPPPASSLNIRYLLAPVNPSDVNVIQGVYPAKPQHADHLATGTEEPVFVGGNEALAEVVAVGKDVDGLNKGDWVILAKQQAGTWSTEATVGPQDVIRVDKNKEGFGDVHAATLTVSTHLLTFSASKLSLRSLT